MREPGTDGNLNVMFFKKIQIICLMTLKITIWELSTRRRNCLGDDFNDLVFLIYCQEHRSSFYMEIIRKHDGQVSTYT